MKLPRDVSGERLAKLLGVFGYEIARQTGSHIRLTSRLRGKEHHLTVPAHDPLRVGILSAILSDVAAYLEVEKANVVQELFGS